MRYSIERHDQVRFDLGAILDFIGNYAGYTIAKRKIAEIGRDIKRLSEYPHSGSPRTDIAAELRVLPSADKGVICFTVDDDRRVVRILCVTYAGQNWQSMAQERREG